MEVRCPHCHAPIDLPSDTSLSNITCPSCGSSFGLLGEDETVSFKSTETKTLGHFELIEQIGVGGFGCVWRARDTELDRTVAVKIPRKGKLDPSESDQFLREARAAAQLRHPNIVSVHEVGREEGTVFIVSDYVEGVTLGEWLTGKKLTAREAAELCAKIADSLHHAHEAGIVHRDLKPGNIMLDADSVPHIMDFGLARREAGEVTITVEGRVLGTPAYMSPEQARGEAHQADRRSDVYSLGVILFELLTGERPFRGSARILLHQIIHDDAPSPRKFAGATPRDLETICLKCLEKEQPKRYQSAKDVSKELGRFLAGEPIQARAIRQIERAWRWCKRNPVVAGLAAGVTMSLIVGMTISTYFAIAADAEANRNHRLLYISDMNVAQQAWEDGNIIRVRELLKHHDPQPGKQDMRDFEWYYLWRAYQRSRVFEKVPVEESPISVSLIGDKSDGLLAIGQAQGTVKLWKLDGSDTPSETAIRQSGRLWSTFVLLSPDGKTLVYPNADNTKLVLQALDSGVRPETLEHSGLICSAAISPDGRLLAAAGPDGPASVWDLESRQLCILPTGAVGDANTTVSRAVAFSPDSNLLAVGTNQGLVEV